MLEHPGPTCEPTDNTQQTGNCSGSADLTWGYFGTGQPTEITENKRAPLHQYGSTPTQYINQQQSGWVHPSHQIKHIRISENRRNERFVLQALRHDHPGPVRSPPHGWSWGTTTGERSCCGRRIPGSRWSRLLAFGDGSARRFAREVGGWGIYRRVARWSSRTASVGAAADPCVVSTQGSLSVFASFGSKNDHDQHNDGLNSQKHTHTQRWAGPS